MSNLPQPVIDGLVKERDSLLKQLDEFKNINARIQAINVLLDTEGKKSDAPVQLKTFSEEKNGYDTHWIWEDKCIYVLKELGKAYSQQIAEGILRHEPLLEKKKVKNKTAYVMSHLYRDERVKKIGQTGKKYLFAPL